MISLLSRTAGLVQAWAGVDKCQPKSREVVIDFVVFKSLLGDCESFGELDGAVVRRVEWARHDYVGIRPASLQDSAPRSLHPGLPQRLGQGSSIHPGPSSPSPSGRPSSL